MLKERIVDFLKGIKTGTVENISLTFGSAGHQVVVIDGINYAMWMDWKEFPKYGTVVKHKPYHKLHRNGTMLCTTILNVVNTPQPES
jgi:hypothetical protein